MDQTGITTVAKGQRVRIALENGDAFDVNVTRASHAPKFSYVDVLFDDGVEGLMWTKLEGPHLVRWGWTRSHAVASITVVGVALGQVA